MARSKGISLTLDGFDKLTLAIQTADGNINEAARECIKESAEIVDAEMQAQMRNAGVDGGLISRLPAPEITSSGNIYSARTGYRKGSYDPHDLSDGYKAVFLNYGTPRRTSHGKVRARGFMQATKKAASPKVKRACAKTLEKILKGLK